MKTLTERCVWNDRTEVKDDEVAVTTSLADLDGFPVIMNNHAMWIIELEKQIREIRENNQ